MMKDVLMKTTAYKSNGPKTVACWISILLLLSLFSCRGHYTHRIKSKNKVVFYSSSTNCRSLIHLENDTMVGVFIYTKSGNLLKNFIPKSDYDKDSLFYIMDTYFSHLDTGVLLFHKFVNGELQFGYKSSHDQKIEFKGYPEKCNGRGDTNHCIETIIYNGKNNYIKLYSEIINGKKFLVEEYYLKLDRNRDSNYKKDTSLKDQIYGRNLMDENGIVLEISDKGVNRDFCPVGESSADTCKLFRKAIGVYEFNISKKQLRKW